MIEVILLGIIFVLTVYYGFVKRSKLLLPGPKGLPFVGYGPFLGEEPYKVYAKLAEKYGPIFKVQLGSQEWVILNNKEVIHEALVKKGKFTADRVHNAMIEAFAQGMAQPFANGVVWKTLRDFDVKALKTFGARAMEACIREEAEHLCRALAEKNGEPCDCELSLLSAVSNVACHITMGRRYEYDDPHYQDILRAVIIFASGDKRAKHFGDIMKAEFLRFLPGYRTSYQSVVDTFQGSRDEIKRRLEERKKTFHVDNVNDIMDQFLVEIQKRKQDRIFTENQLVFALQDFVSASSDTTTNTLRWCIVGLSTNQAHQEKMYQEISEVIGSRGYISTEDHECLSFTHAYIQEILRFCSPLPLSLPHQSTERFTLQGFEIPVNTPIMTNIWAVHRSPELFENPNEFLPERFLDAEGKFISCDDLIAFSVGPRRCLGEQLGKMEVLLFLTHMVSTFHILPDESGRKLTFEEGILSISYSAESFRARFVERSNRSATQNSP